MRCVGNQPECLITRPVIAGEWISGDVYGETDTLNYLTYGQRWEKPPSASVPSSGATWVGGSQVVKDTRKGALACGGVSSGSVQDPDTVGTSLLIDQG